MTQYSVFVTPEAWREIKELPGNFRQRVKRAIDGFAADPRPTESRTLELPGIDREVRRLRLDPWRVIYVVTEGEWTVDVLAVRKRPPYDYGDLQELVDSTEPP